MKKTMPTRLTTALMALMLIGLGLTGCVARYGVVQPSTEVDKAFENHQVMPSHRYYIDGSDVKPNAILAVHNDYTLRSNLWRPVSPTPAQLKEWVAEMTRYRGYALYTFGAKMVGPDGQVVGFWYSPYQTTQVLVEKDKTVQINTPNASAEPERRIGFVLP